MWAIAFNKEGNKILLEQDNPKFYLCNRFFTDEKYKKFSKLPVDEIVSVDSALFPMTERILLDEKTAKLQSFEDGKQILRVQCFDNSKKMLCTEEIDDFVFCGYDLAEECEISALTNCGGFDETFTYKDLNSLGLIPDFLTAQKMQIDLAENNPDEEHADCLLFAVWRRV